MLPVESLYPQAGTFDNGSIIVTDFISNLQYADLLEKKMGEPYCIGYVNYEDFPKYIDFHKIIWDSNHIEFKSNPQNIGWGYCLQAGVGTQFPGGRQMYALNNEEQVDTWFTGSDERTRFINDVKMATLNTRFGTAYGSGVFPFRLDCVSLILNNEIASDNFVADIQYFNNQTGQFSESISINTTFSEFENFIKNEGTLTFTTSSFGTFNIKLSDFNEFNIATVQNTDQTFTMYLAIRNLYTSAMSVHGYDGSYYSRMLVPFFCYKFGDLATTFLPDISTVYIPAISLNIPYISFRILQSGTNYVIDPINLYLYSENRQGCQTGERPFSVTTEDLQNANVQYRTVGIVAGKFMIGNGGGESTNHVHYLYTQNNPVEIYKYLLFYHKAFAGNTIPSASDRWETYYPEWTTSIFDENDSPTGERITGSYTDAAFMAKLRPWQIPDASITVNEFNADDIPEYEPPEPGSGEDWDGDRILPPVISGIGDLNGFITMYGMTPSQVAALGSYLWARFTDATFWESISAVLDNTASIDPSVILNYVVSIRAYPFDLSDVAGTTNELPLVYFGRGLIGIPVEASVTSRSLRILHKCVDTFAGGDLSVPAKYGDFRDMEPCAKLLLHVPFCGSCEINPSQVVGKHLFLRYTIDFATGGMMAICYTSDSAGNMAYPVAELHGHVGASVQLTGSNELDALQSLAGVGFGIASLMMDNPAGLLSGVVGAASSLASNRAVPHSTGRASGFSAYFQPRVPYIEIVYDQYYKPSNYAHIHGNACQAVKRIGSLHGYTVCQNVDTSGMSCESDERIMIKRIMESGFYVD